MLGMPRFHMIDGKKPPDTQEERSRKRRRSTPKPAEMIQCHRCGGREVIETKIGMVMKDGKAVGGTKVLICASCLPKGDRVVIA